MGELVGGLPDPDWYFDNVLVDASPRDPELWLDDLRPAAHGPATEWRRWWDGRAVPRSCAAARDSGFVLSVRSLVASGITRSAWRHAIRVERWCAVGRGWIGVVDVRSGDRFLAARRNHALVACAAAAARPGHVVSGRSAAVLHGLPTLYVPDTPELTASRTRRRGVRNRNRVFAATLQESSVQPWFGVPVTTVARTLVDLARHDRRDAIMAADAALREGVAGPACIDRALHEAAGWPGIRQARAVLGLADPRAESPLESITRLAMHDDGFPPVQPQVWIGGDRVDLYLADSGLVVEADGRVKYSGDELWREKRREQRLRQRVRTVERVTWSDVITAWPATSARLRAAMTR